MHLKSKAELFSATHAEREKLEQKIASMTPAELVHPGTMGDWSVKDILQHLVDWEQRWISWYEGGKRGESVMTPEPGYNWRQMGLLNERYRLKHADRSLEAVQADFEASYQHIMKLVEEIPLIAWIAGNTCEHYRWAIQMIHPQSIRRKMAARKVY
jgi:hypothetical protein